MGFREDMNEQIRKIHKDKVISKIVENLVGEIEKVSQEHEEIKERMMNVEESVARYIS